MPKRNVPYGLMLDQNSAVSPRRSSALSFFAQAGSARTGPDATAPSSLSPSQKTRHQARRTKPPEDQCSATVLEAVHGIEPMRPLDGCPMAARPNSETRPARHRPMATITEALRQRKLPTTTPSAVPDAPLQVPRRTVGSSIIRAYGAAHSARHHQHREFSSTG